MAASCDVRVDEDGLKTIFNEAEDILWSLESGSIPNDNHYQESVLKAKSFLENATVMVSKLDIFSTNEFFEEIATSDMRYLLLPAYLGCIVLKLNNTERTVLIETSEAYFRDFISRCKSYEIIDEVTFDSRSQPKLNTKVQNNIAQLSTQREEKIARFKKQKERDHEIETLKKCVHRPHVDEDTKRKYYLLLIEKWIDKAFEELESISLEKKFLEMKPCMSSIKDESMKRERLKPIVITKNDLQKKVFGAGYRNLPTMTLDEFYEREVQNGRLPDTGTKINNVNKSEHKEDSDDDDVEDPEKLKKLRNMDDWKDDHRRGWGNRMNRS